MTLDEQIKALEDEKQEQTDEFYSRENIIETLSDILQQKETETVYVSPPVQKKAPNYILYLGLAAAAYMFLKK